MTLDEIKNMAETLIVRLQNLCFAKKETCEDCKTYAQKLDNPNLMLKDDSMTTTVNEVEGFLEGNE